MLRSSHLVALFLLVPALALATVPPEPAYRAWVESPGALYISPAGNGPTLGERGLTITVEILDADLVPIVGYPFQDIWVGDDNGDLNVCPGGSVADADTDATGTTTISRALAGGGSTTAGLRAYVGGVPFPGSALPVAVNSPDINGDRRVDLTDVGAFAAGFGGGSPFELDLNQDGNVNIADLGVFAQHVGESCP